MRMVQFTLESGCRATFLFNSNLVVIETPECVKIDDGVHNNAGWKLASWHKYDLVLQDIVNAREL